MDAFGKPCTWGGDQGWLNSKYQPHTVVRNAKRTALRADAAGQRAGEQQQLAAMRLERQQQAAQKRQQERNARLAEAARNAPGPGAYGTPGSAVAVAPMMPMAVAQPAGVGMQPVAMAVAQPAGGGMPMAMATVAATRVWLRAGGSWYHQTR